MAEGRFKLDLHKFDNTEFIGANGTATSVVSQHR